MHVFEQQFVYIGQVHSDGYSLVDGVLNKAEDFWLPTQLHPKVVYILPRNLDCQIHQDRFYPSALF